MEKRSEVEIARIAANYWLGFLTDPQSAKFDNGDTSQTGAMAQMLFGMAKSKQQPCTKEQGEQFFHALVLKLVTDQTSSIHVDYNPDYILGKIMDDVFGKNGWNSSATFPVKTNMWINWTTGLIQVSEGYRAPTKNL